MGSALEKRLTAPTTAKACPLRVTYLRPKMSLSEPAMEKETDDAIDHPPGIQAMFETSPNSVPIWKRIAVMRRNPPETGPTKANPRNCIRIAMSVRDIDFRAKVHLRR
jgi:hypothetical protein